MTLEETRRVVEGYVDDRGGYWLAEDVELELAGGERRMGRREVGLLAQLWPRSAGCLTLEDGRAVVEWNTGLAAVFEVEGGEIVRARVYQGPANPEGGFHVP